MSPNAVTAGVIVQTGQAQSRVVEVKAATWSDDENLVVAVIGPAGSAMRRDMSVIAWDVRTGRIVDRARFPSPGDDDPYSIFVHAIAIEQRRDARGAAVTRLSISTSMKDDISGTCANLIISRRFGTQSWQPGSDPNTRPSCTAGKTANTIAPSGKIAVAATPKGIAIIRADTRSAVRALDTPAPYSPADKRPFFQTSGEATSVTSPRIILQAQSFNEEAKLAIWTSDETRVIAVMGPKGSVDARDLSMVVWDFRTGDIVNRDPLPEIGGNGTIFVHELYLNEGSKLELRASVNGEAGKGCKSIILRYNFRNRGWLFAQTDLNRSPLCAVEYPPNPSSPSGRYRLSETQSPLAVLQPGTGEIIATLSKPAVIVIADAALSPDGKIMAMVTAPSSASGVPSSLIFDFEASRLTELSAIVGSGYDRVQWLNAREFVLLRKDGTGPISTIDSVTGKAAGPPVDGQCRVGQRGETAMIAGVTFACRRADADDASTALKPQRLSSSADGYWSLDYERGKDLVYTTTGQTADATRSVLSRNIVAAGRFPDTALSWFATKSDGIVLVPGNPPYTPREQFFPRVYFFGGARFFAIKGSAYDTNLPADTNFFRWARAGYGFESLGPQTFMRTAFRPKLLPQMLDCTRKQTCDDVFRWDFSSVSTVLPTLTINRVVPGVEPNTANIEVTVREKKGAGRSEDDDTALPYNVRLFRDGALVAQYPKLNVDEDLSDIAVWRQRNLVALDPDGSRHLLLTVALPSGTAARRIAFTAYAFNQDRVKTETVRADYTPPAAAKPRTRRAFVLAFGIDDYDLPSLKLNFAVSDARLISARLADIPGYDVRRVTIASRTESGKRVSVTALTIAHTIAILRGVNVMFAKKELKRQGIDASQLEPPTPDDIVIMSFSGHGWADKTGTFYLVPSNAQRAANGEMDRSTLISATQMADRLREVDAGEMAMIIDACHSAASVDGGGFKPGPMGDPGLGQLAFDKGIRILAATQADDVALESATLRQGLLTYALASEGITDTGGLADKNNDGRITLDEWLRYAVGRLPGLSEDVRLGRFASANANTSASTGSRDLTLLDSQPKARPKPQEPALFDFTGTTSPVVLRETPK